MVVWLDELFSALDLGNNIILVGLSYGAWQTSLYALHHPERLDRIVLLAPAATLLPMSREFLFWGLLTLVPHRYFVRKAVGWFAEDVAENDITGQALIDHVADNLYLAIRSFKFKMLVNPTVLRDDKLGAITVPALCVIGEKEKIYPADDAIRRIRSVAPQIEVTVIPNAGHILTTSEPEVVNRRILEFISE